MSRDELMGKTFTLGQGSTVLIKDVTDRDVIGVVPSTGHVVVCSIPEFENKLGILIEKKHLHTLWIHFTDDNGIKQCRKHVVPLGATSPSSGFPLSVSQELARIRETGFWEDLPTDYYLNAVKCSKFIPAHMITSIDYVVTE